MIWFQVWWIVVPLGTVYAWWQIGEIAADFPPAGDPRLRGIASAIMGLLWPLVVPRALVHLFSVLGGSR